MPPTPTSAPEMSARRSARGASSGLPPPRHSRREVASVNQAVPTSPPAFRPPLAARRDRGGNRWPGRRGYRSGGGRRRGNTPSGTRSTSRMARRGQGRNPRRRAILAAGPAARRRISGRRHSCRRRHLPRGPRPAASLVADGECPGVQRLGQDFQRIHQTPRWAVPGRPPVCSRYPTCAACSASI